VDVAVTELTPDADAAGLVPQARMGPPLSEDTVCALEASEEPEFEHDFP
jgi:hypothetical protein